MYVIVGNDVLRKIGTETIQERLQRGGQRQPITWANFTENCAKMKKFGRGAGEGGKASKIVLCTSASAWHCFRFLLSYSLSSSFSKYSFMQC